MMMKSFLLIATLVARLALAQSAGPAGELPVIATTGAFFAVSVADMKASADWYSKTFGLKVVMVTPKTEKAAATLLEGGGLIVELIQHDDALPMSKGAPGVQSALFLHGVFKAGVVVDDFDRTLAALKARRVEIAFGPFPARANQRANVIIKDNAGNLIQILGK